MTREELDEQIEQAVVGFSSIDGVASELAEKLVGEGFLSYDNSRSSSRSPWKWAG